MCWWNHEIKERRNEVTDCFVCNKTFSTKSTLMLHRKTYHSDIVRNCTDFSEVKCKFKEDSCWYKHVKKNSNIDEFDSGFQNVKENLEPPLRNQQRKEQSSEKE